MSKTLDNYDMWRGFALGQGLSALPNMENKEIESFHLYLDQQVMPEAITVDKAQYNYEQRSVS